MSINQRQIDYAITRVQQIAQQKINAIVNARRRPANKQLEAFLEAFKAGKVKVLSRAARYGEGLYYLGDINLATIFDMSPYTREPPEDEDETRKQEINKERDRICDQLMLGDAAEALKLVQAFEAF